MGDFRLYAMFATPIAYLIDEHGVIMHEVAVGADGIFRLLGGKYGEAVDFKSFETA
jgi:hypothetical protein